MTILACQVPTEKRFVIILLKTGNLENHMEIQQYGSSSVYYNQTSLGNDFASSCEIEVAASLLQQHINFWLECKNNSGITSHILSTFQPSTH